jgi:polyhydroxybutyrate depolymerase
MRRTTLALLAACAVIEACGQPEPSTAATVTPRNTPRDITPPVAATQVPANGQSIPSFAASAPPIVGGRQETIGGDRPTTLYVPDVDGPMPLVMLLHVFGGSSQWQEDYWRLGRVAASHGMAFLHPDGTAGSRGTRFWNATEACCDYELTGVDDSAYLDGLIAEAEAMASIDPRRVYVVGHSNGGFMSYRMACEHSGEIAAIATFGAAMFARSADCRPSEPVAVLHIHGAADRTIPYGGMDVERDPLPASPEPRALDTSTPTIHIPGALESTEMWAAYDGCEPNLIATDQRVDVAAGLVGPTGPAESTVSVASGCDPGGHVELWTIPDAGHFPELSLTFADSVVGFLLAHPKP